MRSHILGFGALVLATAATALICLDASAGGTHHWQPENGNWWFTSENWEPERDYTGLDVLHFHMIGQADCSLSGSNDTISGLAI